MNYMEEERERMDELIVSYLTDNLDDSSFSELKKWIATSPEHETYFRQKQEIWFSALDTDQNRYDKERAFNNFKVRIAAAKKTGTGIKDRLIRSLWHYAAIAVVLCLVSYFSYWRGEEVVKENFAEIVVEAPLGSRTKLFLPDGTLVWLNAGSRMSYSQGFGVEKREVNLVGEGYFEVKKNEELPFSVQTKSLRVRVVGTKFNFRDYPEDNEVMVTLLEGKVVLNNLIRPEKELSLAPNERVILDKQSGKMQLERVVASNALQWKNGYLFFDEELLPDIAKKLERSYNVKVYIANEALRKYRFYGNFVRSEQSIREVLDVLSATGKIRYNINGREITLY